MTTHVPAIDIRRWHREGLLRVGVPFSRVLHYPGGSRALIQVKPFPDRLVIAYGPSGTGNEALAREEGVPVVWTRCQFGGNRPWFRCPRPTCGRRAAVLYDNHGLACRRCHGLIYPSQRESVTTRALRKADRIRERLGWEPWEFSATGRRPKGMHLRTFRRLQVLRARLMIQALGGAKQRLRSISLSLDGRK
jgi:hypothetical protein